uniref:Uncharacterized protein n=1 Tax=viral metagenome TaxID=1070528 RepID=A0A6C0B2L9_9ZZZZ
MSSLTYYPNKLFNDYNISTYKKFMLTKETKDDFVYSAMKREVILVEKEVDTLKEVDHGYEPDSEPEFFQPRQQDTLFWCLYVIHHGHTEYQRIGHNYGVKELEEKQRLAKFINENKLRIKSTNHKVTNVLIQEILSELLTSQKETSLSVLGALTVFYDINVLLICSEGRCMLEYWATADQQDSDRHTYVLFKDKYGKYRAQLEWISTGRLIELREKYMVLDNYLKPMKAASHYKAQDLIDLARKLSIYDENKKYTKVELYDTVRELCVWK